MVHENSRLTNAVKFAQLINHLESRALNVIRAIEPLGDNYSRAWKSLLARFDQPQMLINSHLKRFFEIKPIKSGNSNTNKLLTS